jgi:hypothetical protein
MNTRHQFISTFAAALASLAVAHGQSTFTKVTNGPIVTDVAQFTAPTWADFRHSGNLDLFIGNYDGQNCYYRNDGGGNFTKITQGPELGDTQAHTGAAVADFDNDGFPDMFVIEGEGGDTAEHNGFYHNNGDGTFTAESAGGVTNAIGYSNTAATADYDNDGFVDLWVSDDGGPTVDGAASQLYHNNGDGTFKRVFSNALVTDILGATCAEWVDYDNDGHMDLTVPSVGTTAQDHVFVYHNNGNGTFTRVMTNVIATDTWSSGAWGLGWGDYDNDGLPDLFVPGFQSANRLYHNEGNGAFSRVSSGAMLNVPPGGGCRACVWGDYDNDGYLDLYICCHDAKNRLFHNNGDGTFTQILAGDPVNDGGPGTYTEACGFVDYDNDGFLDLFANRISVNNAPSSNFLYHNNGNSNAWLEVKLVGTVANRSAIGAKVRAYATIGGKTMWQMREMTTGSGRSSQPLVAHFGLGDATNVTTLRIEWPSGTVQEIPNVGARQILTVTEPARLISNTTNGVPQFSLNGGRNLSYEIDSSTDLQTWSPLTTTTVTNLSGITNIIDTDSASAQRFYRAVSR